MKSKHRGDTLDAGFLRPSQEVVKIDGRLLYQESAQAWTILKMKKEIVRLFPQLGEKSSSFKYRMIIPRSQEEVLKEFSELQKDENRVPILLFFEKSSVSNETTLSKT